MERPAICGGKPVRETKIYYGHQYLDQADYDAVLDVLKSDYLTCGPKINELEAKLCEITGAKYAVVCSNGTAALHMAAMAAGIKEGDELITTPITFAASANCALYCGGRPVFADINEKTYNIDPSSVEEHITPATKAVVAVDYTGQAVELDRLLSICHKHNLVLIEDGAHSIGTKYNGKGVGSIADMTTFSFHPVKTITGGEGGAVLTNSEEYYQKLLLARSHGITRVPRHLYILRLNLEKLTINRREFFDALAAENICCNVHYIPVYYFPHYKRLGYTKGLCPKAEKLYDEMITLPLYYGMSNRDCDDVIRAVLKIAAYYHKE